MNLFTNPYLILFVCLFIFIFSRVLYIKKNHFPPKRRHPMCVFIIIGSGGHTTEMLKLIKDNMNLVNYSPRYYIKSNNDLTSEAKILNLESTNRDFNIVNIPRSRQVHQSYISSIWTTFVAILFSFLPLIKYKPEMILCNGPGTCFPPCFMAFLMRLFWIINTKIVFVESICRVQTLSLTGHLLLHFSDHFIVQWPELKEKYPKTKYFGKITL